MEQIIRTNIGRPQGRIDVTSAGQREEVEEVDPTPSRSFPLSVPHNSISLTSHILYLSKLSPTSDNLDVQVR
jgi:hypothetical protein